MKQTSKLFFLDEPELEFGLRQRSTNPKAGLYFFGPLEEKTSPKHIKIGVVGTRAGLNLYRDWAKALDSYIEPLVEGSLNHVPYGGFQSIFSAKLSAEPELEVVVSEAKLARAIRTGKRHEAIREAVSIFEDAIQNNLEQDSSVDVWFVVIPDDVYRYGRPRAIIPKEEAVRSGLSISRRRAAEILAGAPSLFAEENQQAEIFLFEPNFHHQLKARLLSTKGVVLQIMRESTLEALTKKNSESSRRRLQDPASIAWNLSTTLFFKGGGHPWKLAFVRPRVCYIGLVFKLFPDSRDTGQKACCGAQMFLGNGDGLVFRGAPGNWYNPTTREFHLSEDEAQSLIEKVVQAYRDKDEGGCAPDELFIHGRTRFNSDECRGFAKGAPGTKINTIRITERNDFRLFAPRSTPVMRGTAMQADEHRGYLWTRGFVPELGTYPGREVPRPLAVEIVSGEADIQTVMRDLLMLTKLNFNACIYADGFPVTLRFADAVGEIITAIPEWRSIGTNVPEPFKRYI